MNPLFIFEYIFSIDITVPVAIKIVNSIKHPKQQIYSASKQRLNKIMCIVITLGREDYVYSNGIILAKYIHDEKQIKINDIDVDIKYMSKIQLVIEDYPLSSLRAFVALHSPEMAMLEMYK